jgi:putative ABC transport system permease protein
MTRTKVLFLFMAETLAMGLAASLSGAGAGILLADAALFLVGDTVNSLFFMTDLSRGSLTLKELWIALGSGLGVSVLAALHPAWEATRVSPLEGARQTPWAPRFPGIFSRGSMIGLGLLLMVPGLLLWSPANWSGVGRFSLGVSGMMVFLLSLSFLSPLFVQGWARLVRRLFSRFRWVEGQLAAGNLARNPVRSGITVGTIMVSLAAIFTVAAFVHSVRGSLLAWVDQMVTADLVVHSSAKTAGPMNVPLREELAAALEAIPGVRSVDLYRLVRSTYEGRPIVVESFSARLSGELRNLPMVEGDAKQVLARMAAGEGVVASESFWRKFGRGRGDVLLLPTPSGAVPFTVLGIYLDYSSDQGSILMDRSLYKKNWGDELVDAFDLWLTPGADQGAVIREIKEKYGTPYQLFISTHRELKEAVVEVMEQSFTVNYAVEIVAVVVAIFSVVNTLLASVADRVREIGVLRAIGAAQGQLRRMVLAEAASIGSLGGILGLLAGSIMSYHHVVYNTKALTGWTFRYYYPVDVALGSLAAAVALCLLAGYLPARKAASIRIVEAIGYE